MKKKTVKKLELAKETVRDLGELTLRQAAGASGICLDDPTLNQSCGILC
jgi:hypothetical protein